MNVLSSKHARTFKSRRVCGVEILNPLTDLDYQLSFLPFGVNWLVCGPGAIMLLSFQSTTGAAVFLSVQS